MAWIAPCAGRCGKDVNGGGYCRDCLAQMPSRLAASKKALQGRDALLAKLKSELTDIAVIFSGQAGIDNCGALIKEIDELAKAQ